MYVYISLCSQGKTESYRVRVCRTCTKYKLPLELGSYADVESALIVNDTHELLQGRTKQLHLLVSTDITHLNHLVVRKRGGIKDVPVLQALEERLKKSFLKASSNTTNTNTNTTNNTTEGEREMNEEPLLMFNHHNQSLSQLISDNESMYMSSATSIHTSHTNHTSHSMSPRESASSSVFDPTSGAKSPLDVLSEIAGQQVEGPGQQPITDILQSGLASSSSSFTSAQGGDSTHHKRHTGVTYAPNSQVTVPATVPARRKVCQPLYPLYSLIYLHFAYLWLILHMCIVRIILKPSERVHQQSLISKPLDQR